MKSVFFPKQHEIHKSNALYSPQRREPTEFHSTKHSNRREAAKKRDLRRQQLAVQPRKPSGFFSRSVHSTLEKV